ncbi:hypothetical protein, unlikely [Trypanosoma congolense IL3000]|uniref:Protein phosphatase n=1 Tax=Trypanosoma congolense (strain IL3000) TaxID=1068625 RepID=F9WGR4_TRYCI|nr:hypothetical protein, unlikely [Trypanosoma congolense IL3000]
MNVSRGLLQPTKSKALLGFSFRAVKWAPHPKRADTGGEDAFMSHLDAQGVFDGVSWWRNHVGVNSGLYSAALARSLHEVIEEVAAPATMSSLDLLQRAYDRSLAKGIPGTSTALVMTLQCSGGGACTSDGGETTEFINDVWTLQCW